MAKKLCFWLGLVLGMNSLAFGASESKGFEGAASEIVDREESEDITIYFIPTKQTDRDMVPSLNVSRDFIARFDLLEALTADVLGAPVYEIHLPDTVVSWADLMNLKDLVTNPADFIEYGFLRLARILNLANELGASQITKQLLQPALESLRLDMQGIASLALAQEIKHGNADIKLPLLQQSFPVIIFDYVRDIVWQPNGKSYWVIFDLEEEGGYLAWNYNLAGERQFSFDFVRNIVWHPSEDSYFVIYANGTAQRYNISGKPQGARIDGVQDIIWQPNGSDYFVIFYNGDAQKHNLLGAPYGALFNGVEYIEWQPNSESYWVIFRDGRAISTGGPHREQLSHVLKIEWQPNSESYWVIFRNGKAQRYNSAGMLQTGQLLDVLKIIWQPDSESYWVIFGDGKAQRYNSAGVLQIGQLLDVLKIVWKSDSDSYWAIFGGGITQKYNITGGLVDQLKHVENIYPQPNGEAWLAYDYSGRVQLFQSFFKNIPLYQQVLVQSIMNRFLASDGKKIKLSEEEKMLLMPQVIANLNQIGWIKEGSGCVVS